MKASLMKTRIAKVLEKARASQKRAGAYAFLPEIIQSLEAMETNVTASDARRERMASALGRLVTEDVAFSESPLGGEMLQLADELAP